jgi:tetratricopeptide (TPR) repeat protein
VFVVALVVRLAVAAELWNLPIVRTPKLDSSEYVSWARRLAAGDFAWPVISPHGPGYPFFLAALLLLGSGSLSVAMAVQAIVGALTAVTLALAAREWFGSRAGLLAGLVYALYGPAVYIDTALLSEGLLIFLLAIPLLVLSREPVTRARAAAAGAALGAATLVRPTAALTAAACVAWLLLSVRRRQPHAAALAAYLVVAALLVVSPAALENWSVSRSLSIQGYGGLNFYIGNSPLHAGRSVLRLGAGWDALNAEASRAGIADPAAQDRYYVAKTLAEIRRYPVAFMTLLAKKSLWVVQAEEVRDSHSFYFFAGQSRILRVLPRMAILFPLACVGALAMARRRARASLLAYHAAAAAAGTVLLVIGMRYRMPLVPALAVAAGAGLTALADSVAARRIREAAMYASVALVAVLVSHRLSDPRNLNPAEEWAFTGSSLVTEHNLTEAEAAYRRALSLDESSGFAWDGLGLVHYDAGRLADARRAFDRAAALDPDSARATFHLALLDEREGRAPQAIAGYARALDLSPDDAEITRHLGTALGMAGRLEEARAQFRRLVQLTPSNGEAWLDLCLLSLDAHDVDAAAAALQSAREWGARPDRLALASDALARAMVRPSRDD